MHIFLALIGILTFVAVWYWRLKLISGAARDGYKAAKGFADKRRRARPPPASLARISDPREAAAVMMLEIARTRGAVSEQKKAAIRAEMIDHFGFSDAEAGDLIRRAGLLTRKTPPPKVVMSRMGEVIVRSPGMGPKEFDDLCAMLENVAVADGRVSAEETDLIQVWRRKAGLN